VKERIVLDSGDRLNAVVEFDFDAILRADLSARMESYQKGVQAGVIAPNEARAKEHLPPKDGGNELYIQGNMMPLSKAGDVIDQRTQTRRAND
jgi:phage portal protein BeeE